MKLKATTGLSIWTSLSISLFVISCQREVDFEPSESPTNAPDSIFLKKFVELDTTRVAPFDTVSYSSFEYDASDRIKNCYEVRPHDPDIDTVLIATYFYHGTDTLPYKVETISVGNNNRLTVSLSAYWQFDNMGRLISDSVTAIDRDDPAQENWQVFTSSFSYSQSMVNYNARHRIFTIPSSPNSFENIFRGKVLNTIFNNCIVRQVDSTFNVSSNDGFINTDTIYFENITDLQYDLNPNPFLQIYPANYPVSHLMYYGFTAGWEQAHNLTSMNTRNSVYYTNGPSPFISGSSASTFNYRNDGYPVVKRQSIPIGGGQFINTKAVFIYGR